MIDERFAGLLRAWRKRFKVTRVGAAYALRAAAGWKTNDHKLLTRETAKALPQRPLAALELIHGLLAVYPPKPLISPRDFAKRLRDWRRAHCLTQMQACMALGLSLLVFSTLNLAERMVSARGGHDITRNYSMKVGSTAVCLGGLL